MKAPDIGTVTRRRVSIAGLLLVLLSGACGLVSEDEVARVRAPGGAVDAVVLETNGGATTSYGYSVILTKPGSRWPTGTEVAFLYGAVSSPEAYGVNVKWQSANELAVEYFDAHWAELRQPKVTMRGTSVRTTLVAGISDGKSQKGGMVDNLKGSPHD